MECEKIHWVLCPACWGKTRTWIREDTVLENFPLFCSKCKQTFLVAAHSGKVEYRAIMPDARTQSRIRSHSRFALRFCVEGKETEPL